jgi:predicted small integral membrane protein
MDTANFGAELGTGLDDDVTWRTIESETLQDIAYVGIIAWESAAALVLLAATALWVRDRGTSYRLARRVSTIGPLMVIALFFGGFIVIGGEWFQRWKSTEWNGLDPAFRNTVLAAVGLLAVHLPPADWDH